MQRQHAQVLSVSLLCFACVLYIALANRQHPPAPQAKRTRRPHKPVTGKQVWILYSAGWGSLSADKTWGAWRIKASSWSESYREPPNDVAIVHEPRLGLYSSHAEAVLREHLQTIQDMGIDCIVVPWNSLTFTDTSLKMLFDTCQFYDVQIVPLVPALEGRNGTTVQADLDYFKERYLKASAQYKWHGRPLVIVQDAQDLRRSAEIVIDNPEFRFMASAVSYHDFLGLYEDGFLGFVSYFASDEQSWGSNHGNWGSVVNMSMQRGMTFVPTVSPGFNDSAINRWNSRNWRSRNCSEYYDTRWNAAIDASANIIMINSWNNWAEGSVIEPVVDSRKKPLSDDIWCGKDPNYYVTKTTEWVARFKGKVMF